MQNCTFFVLLRPIFSQKIASPKGSGDEVLKELPLKLPLEEAFEIGRKIRLSFGEDPFFFWRSPVYGRKNRLNFRFRPANPSRFWWKPFFLLRSRPVFGTGSISEKPFESDSKAMKIWVKVAFSCLSLSKKPPPLFFKSWLRAWPVPGPPSGYAYVGDSAVARANKVVVESEGTKIHWIFAH